MDTPKYGFGDPTSYRLIEDLIEVTSPCGAVRHGAECFNFYFPQELDDEFLVVWENFSDPPWKTHTEPELRQFLLARAQEGYSFALNPLWPIRDPGWFEVLEALKKTRHGRETLDAWFPPETGVLERIEALHKRYPRGLVEPAQNGAEQSTAGQKTPMPKRRCMRTMAFAASDLTASGMAEFATDQGSFLESVGTR